MYFFDTGLVKGDDAVRFENAVAGMLLNQVHWRQDTQGVDTGLQYVRTKDGAEVDFCLSEQQALTHLIECKFSDNQSHRALVRFAAQFPQAHAVQLVCDLRQTEVWQGVRVERAGEWLLQMQAPNETLFLADEEVAEHMKLDKYGDA